MGPQTPGLTTAGTMGRRQPNLAFIYQELLIVGERLRDTPPRLSVTDAAAFRDQLLKMLDTFMEESQRQGYSQEDVRLVDYVVVAFIDESILNLRLPVFAGWVNQPLQLKRYGHQNAGEIAFTNIANLVTRNDSNDLADVLEVYFLCMLLGLTGKYSMGGYGQLSAIQRQIGEKIQRIRKTTTLISPSWQLPNDGPPRSQADPWVNRLMYGAIGCLALTIVLFILFKVLLSGGVSTMAGLTKGGQ